MAWSVFQRFCASFCGVHAVLLVSVAGWGGPGVMRAENSSSAPAKRAAEGMNVVREEESISEVVTAPEMLVGDEPAPVAGGSMSLRRLSGQRRWPAVLFLLGVVLVLVMTFIRLPYYAFSPGSVNPLADRIVVTGVETFAPEGEVMFTTVSQDSSVNGWEYLWAKWDDSVLLLDEDLVMGDRDRGEVRAFNLALMRVSKSTAVAVALLHLGFEPFVATGVGMASVEGPAEGLLTTDDVIRSINGVVVDTTEELVVEIRRYAPGETLVFAVEAVDGSFPREVSVVMGAREDDPSVAFLGIQPQTRTEDAPGMPFNAHVDTGSVGGNSAGLALTLSVLDLVTPGELTGGFQVATTGTISLSGAVGPIGGIEQKTVAAREAGVDLFLVPMSELAAAQRQAGDLNVVGVATLDEALVALAALGGNALELSLP